MANDVPTPAGAPAIRAARSPSDGARRRLAPLLRVVRRRFVLMLFTAVAGVLVATLVVLRATPLYTGAAVAAVRSADGRVSADPAAIAAPGGEERIDAALRRLRSPDLARAVAVAVRLEGDAEFAPPPTVRGEARTDAAAAALAERLSVRRAPRSGLIRVSATSADPFKAALLANKLLEVDASRGADGITVVSPALTPDLPSSPVPARALTMAAPAALALGMLFAFAAEAMGARRRSPAQAVPRRTDGTARAPGAPEPSRRLEDAARVLLAEAGAESIRGRSRLLLIASPLEDENGRPVAPGLAVATAVMGPNAVVLDLDLRRPARAATTRP